MAYLTIEKLNNIIFDNLDENGDEYKIFIESGTFLGGYGFERVETYWPEDWYNWGDALYIKKK